MAVLLALAAYFAALKSDHAATNGDELLYAQMTYATAESGHWLPLHTLIERHRNTKPPGLFWQGLVSTNWAESWSLCNLRWPNVLYTLATALMVFVLALTFVTPVYFMQFLKSSGVSDTMHELT